MCLAPMAAAEHLTTCLSEAVHHMVCQLGFERADGADLGHFVTVSGQVCWETITSTLHMSDTEEHNLDYVESVRQLGPVCKSVHSYLLSLSAKQFKDQYDVWFKWTDNSELFIEVFEASKSSQHTAIALGLMKLTACLERALGNVFLMIGKDCPFLLRDLLASRELATVFGQNVMNVLRVFLGSPRSLNLRNILWHGFAAPGEIPPMYTSMLLLLTAGLGQILQTESMPLHRPYFRLTQLEELAVFPDINEEAIALAEDFIGKSGFVVEIMRPYWREALEAYRNQRYADCVILLLPQLETGLRKLFTVVNNCPNRLLTAESTTLYTTFDEMLAKYLEKGDTNQLPTALGDPIVEILWDLLNHQEGPRIRDHLSHGELDLNTFPEEMASHMVALAIVLLHRCCRKGNETVKESECLKAIISSMDSYCSRFHPIGRLKQQLRHCVGCLQKWNEIPRPSVEQTSEGPGQLHLVTKLLGSSIRTLYCPRTVLEVVALLRKVVSQCLTVSEQVTSGAVTRQQLWLSKSLRSRQRHNYLRMLGSVQYLHSIFSLITLLVTVELLNTRTISEMDSSECRIYLKFLKSLLQYTENTVTYTSPGKNKWEETWDLTEKMQQKVKEFYNRWNDICAMSVAGNTWS
ncbi:endoplasmic reticulum membrane-associated RNA degradation protein-like isoform X2 [Hypanus sabinus]|uniref:endoplasmic reticulum membrane-associated RNA degradation protein-like isoform X2 n=1 Tax=Hypanus sabinus TaxID=79690 RepID=UPI0028C424AF|nr:endoplasmic reticulum membrane-associated RNA degradation protein-like isoform X2 [Hypanus sabinus]